jgi:hypothetical protein
LSCAHEAVAVAVAVAQVVGDRYDNMAGASYHYSKFKAAA